MTTIPYPSDLAPGPVPVTIDVPDGWLVEAAPEVAFVAASPEDTDGVHVNVVVAVRRITADVSAQELAGSMAEDYAALDGVTVTSVEAIDLGGRAGALFTATFSDPDAPEVIEAETVRQLQLVCVAPVSDHVADAVSATVTYPGSASEDRVRGFRDIVGSVRVG